LPRQVFREPGDIEREGDCAAYGVDVAHANRGGDGTWIDEGDAIPTSFIETETYDIDAGRAAMEDAAAMSAGLARLTARRYGDPR
jgi:hypothetical protein